MFANASTFVDVLWVASVWIIVALFFWKVYPLMQENELYRKACEIVHRVEEVIGAGNGTVKYDNAVSLLSEWVKRMGWKIPVDLIASTVTAAVGALHGEQGKEPKAIEQHTEEEPVQVEEEGDTDAE